MGLRIFLLAFTLTFLAACGTTGKKTASSQPTPGKYYQDDGPPDAVPDGLDQVPDAVPRKEPFHKFANRPYAVFGETYVPVVDEEPYKQRGLASWYGRKFHGQKTSSGETYDMFAMTAAHKTLPIPSYARVTNLANGKSVVVRINDRGPFHKGRIIDLSYAAAKRIGIVGRGSAMVEVERVFEPEDAARHAATTAPAPQAAPGKAVPDNAAYASPPVPTAIVTPVVAEEPAGLWIQLGAFASAEGAQSFRDHVTRSLPWLYEPVQVSYRDGLHRVRLGPYRTKDEATAIADKVERSLGITPAVSTNR
ncbi:MAG TPA: septal ring lytic transglycosylase RlpA family protein [Usitatibacter sp.]|jgi:rare lipoprotein A|nr:septal ring lytic transglycosylase RlpA family protein [Usitatibacter sp.]